VYNFAAMPGVGPSFSQPEYTMNVSGVAVVRLLEAIKLLTPKTKFFQASSSHMFGDTEETPQTEKTVFSPISPYALAKTLAHNTVGYYRKIHNIFACSAIFYAHASPRYSEGFLLSKAIHSIWKIKKDEQKTLEVGNLNVPLDVGYAKEYMEAVFKIMQLKKPDDFILATGEARRPKEIIKDAFNIAGLDIKKHLVINDNLKRITEVSVLTGDYSKAKKAFGFKPKVKSHELMQIMFDFKNQ